MAKKKNFKLRGSSIGVSLTVSPSIKVDFGDFSGDIDDVTPVILRAYIKPTLRHPGYFSLVGIFSDSSGALPAGDVKGLFKNVVKVAEYMAKEKGFHVIQMTTVEDGAAHTYRTAVFKVT